MIKQSGKDCKKKTTVYKEKTKFVLRTVLAAAFNVPFSVKDIPFSPVDLFNMKDYNKSAREETQMEYFLVRRRGTPVFFILFALWLILNGAWTTEIAIVGAVLSGLIYLLIWKFMDYSPKKEWAYFKKIPRAFLYLLYLIREIFKSAWQTIHFIWTAKEEVEPQLRSFHTKLKTDMGRVLLANSITLTPGTITVDVRDDLFLVHCLDEEFAEGIEDSDMQRRVMAVEKSSKEEPHHD